jgi:hypothetical protein
VCGLHLTPASVVVKVHGLEQITWVSMSQFPLSENGDKASTACPQAVRRPDGSLHGWSSGHAWWGQGSVTRLPYNSSIWPSRLPEKTKYQWPWCNLFHSLLLAKEERLTKKAGS